MDALNSVQMDMVQQINKNIERDSNSTSFSPTLCVTHKCNLTCIYCYQDNKSADSMTLDVAMQCIDDIFKRIPNNTELIEISFIGGEPLLEVDLIKDIYAYTKSNYNDERVVFLQQQMEQL